MSEVVETLGLLPCPFCGGVPEHWQNGLSMYRHIIRCIRPECPAGYVCSEGNSLDEAKGKWNTRADNLHLADELKIVVSRWVGMKERNVPDAVKFCIEDMQEYIKCLEAGNE